MTREVVQTLISEGKYKNETDVARRVALGKILSKYPVLMSRKISLETYQMLRYYSELNRFLRDNKHHQYIRDYRVSGVPSSDEEEDEEDNKVQEDEQQSVSSATGKATKASRRRGRKKRSKQRKAAESPTSPIP